MNGLYQKLPEPAKKSGTLTQETALNHLNRMKEDMWLTKR